MNSAHSTYASPGGFTVGMRIISEVKSTISSVAASIAANTRSSACTGELMRANLAPHVCLVKHLFAS